MIAVVTTPSENSVAKDFPHALRIDPDGSEESKTHDENSGKEHFFYGLNNLQCNSFTNQIGASSICAHAA